jgi:hypothetical protein
VRDNPRLVPYHLTMPFPKRERHAVTMIALVVGVAAPALSQVPVVPVVPVITTPRGAATVEQRSGGTADYLRLVASFDGLGFGFVGPQGNALLRNPSDNSLAVGPDHIVQIVNSRMAIFSKKGKRYDTTGRVLYGPVPTNILFRNFGGACEGRLSGDAVVRYDQLANRWLFVLPIFQRGPVRPDQIESSKAGDPAQVMVKGRTDQPGAAEPLYMPPPSPLIDPATPPPPRPSPSQEKGPYSMCYAVSSSADPTGAYFRYEFLRPLFPDYPRPAVWPDGYYVPTSTSDDRISATVATQKHACVVDRARMLNGEPANEQCVIIENSNFLNNADIDGTRLPPEGAPNTMMAAGGRQLDGIFEDQIVNVWQYHVDWSNAAKTTVSGPVAIPVAPYRYLCDGQLSNCVPQLGTDRRLDSQGDKLVPRLAYRNVNGHESIVALHSVNTTRGSGGVRWYEFRIGAKSRRVSLHQQGTFAPDSNYRWLPSAAMDKRGNLIVAYSWGGAGAFAGQRATARLASDGLGRFSSREIVLADGAASQTSTVRWEDYTQTAVDPSDDCTVWYVGDYFKKDAPAYSSRIAALRVRSCR